MVGTSQIASFTVGADGRLTAAPGSPFTAQGLGPFGSEFSPTNPSQLFVSNAHNVGPNTGTVSAFTVSRHGNLTSIGASPFADLQTAPCWVEISHDGRFLFAVNTAVPSISSYRVRSDGSLNLIGSTPFKQPAGLAPEDARLSPRWRDAVRRRRRRRGAERLPGQRRQSERTEFLAHAASGRGKGVRGRGQLDQVAAPAAGAVSPGAWTLPAAHAAGPGAARAASVGRGVTVE